MTQVNNINSKFDIFSPANLKVNNSSAMTFQALPNLQPANDMFVNSDSLTSTPSYTDKLALMMAGVLQNMRSVPVVNQFVPQQPSVQYSDTFMSQSASEINNNSVVVNNWDPMNMMAFLRNGDFYKTPAPSATLKKGTIKVSDKVEKYDSIIQEKAQKYGLDPDFVKCVIQQESGGRANAQSHCGAGGLMQLMPDTAEWLGCEDRFNPEQNIEAGCKYLAKLLKSHDGNMELTLAAYNAGPGNVRKYGGIPPFAETQNYVAKIMDNYNGNIQA